MQKVQNEFKKTLNAAVAAKVQAENKKNELEALNIEKDYLVTYFLQISKFFIYFINKENWMIL